MRVYSFEGISPRLELMPLAVRRALDVVGRKVSLATYQALTEEHRRALLDAGGAPSIDTEHVLALLDGVAAEVRQPRPDPSPDQLPDGLAEALGPQRPLTPTAWSRLEPFERATLAKVFERAIARNDLSRLEAAYAEILGVQGGLSHLSNRGEAHMVSISAKLPTHRQAIAESFVSLNEAALDAITRENAAKGDVLAVARVAGIQAAKKTSELIPLCHPLALSHLTVCFEIERHPLARIQVLCSAETIGATGVEMEALTGASVAALTLYDMLKAVDRTMTIGPTRLVKKTGGKGG